MCSAWIGFWGAVVGGFLTLLGVAVTIIYYNIQGKKEENREYRSGALIVYRFLNVKVDLLCKIYESYFDDSGIKQIHYGPVFTHDENLFLYGRIQYLNRYLDDDEVRELAAFMGQLREYETARSNCLKEKKELGTIISRGAYEIILNNCYGRLDKNDDSENKGIIKILAKMETSLEIDK